jgi:hypothetical protein
MALYKLSTFSLLLSLSLSFSLPLPLSLSLSLSFSLPLPLPLSFSLPLSFLLPLSLSLSLCPALFALCFTISSSQSFFSRQALVCNECQVCLHLNFPASSSHPLQALVCNECQVYLLLALACLLYLSVDRRQVVL